MAEELAERDRGEFEGGEYVDGRVVGLDRGIEIESALLDELHDGDGVEQFGDRAGAVDGVGGGGGLARFVGEAEAGGKNGFLVMDQSNGQPGDLVRADGELSGLLQGLNG